MGFRTVHLRAALLPASHRILIWLIVPAIVNAWRRAEQRAAMQSLLLMLAAIGIDILGVRRGLKSEYFIFTDPLIVLAGAVLLDRLRDLRFHRWTYATAVILLALHIAVGQSGPLKSALRRSGPQSANGTAITCRYCRCHGADHDAPGLPLACNLQLEATRDDRDR